VPAPQKIDRLTRVRIAAQAGVDERTVTRYLRRERRTLPIVARAIVDAARALGVKIREARP
jgi:hypothetical protein